MVQLPTPGTAAHEEHANAADSGKQRGGCLAGSMSSLTEVHENKLSLLSQNGQPL